MGRKIPSKKHRGVKDPVKQQAQRFQSIKDKINAPPTDPDEQPVPRSFERLFAFKEPKAAGSIVKKKKSRSLTAGAKRDDNPVAALKRMPGEEGRAFSLRINSAVRALHNTDQEDYPSDLEETDTRGEYIASQRMRRQKKHRQAAGKRGEQGAGGEGERLSKTQRRALKMKEQKKAKEAESVVARELAARELRYERVVFGDVAHAPPALPPPRRAHLAQGASRPGRRDLLLAGMLNPQSQLPKAQPSKTKAQPSKTKAQRSKTKAQPSKAQPAKAKAQLSAAELMRRERARMEAVDAYRALKKQRAAEKMSR